MNMKELVLEKLNELSTDDLLKIKAAINEELQRRAAEDEFVIYQHDCFDCASYHLHKYKHWAKVVRAVDTKKTDGYAFIGDFLSVQKQHKVPNGSVVVEVCGSNVKAYRITKEKKEKIAESTTNKLVEFIEKVAAALK